ncbi:hypothetical protein [Nitratireductor pacificus]|uniref:Uncharacterized protein n=1 Tax=Nitratireductor pacificus pht-3B TaxID=391937 RepID=K2LMT5_9HYPH|nr:hypothetical protein [Nitratireductor pacificus]EKF19099.1 hypothetical protein NA2_09963 [Nitratireductor pacificus pht-3B]
MSMTIGCRPWRPETEFHWIATLALAAALALQTPLLAQGLDREEAIDAIVGSDVKTEEVEAASATDRLVAAIAATAENAERVRKTFSLEEVDIVFLQDLDKGPDGVRKVLAEKESAIAMLREAIEGSALFYHAVDSRSVMVRNIVALEYGDGDKVTIFVEGPQDNQ